MTTALVVFEHMFPANRRDASFVAAPFPYRPAGLPEPRPAMGPVNGSDWIVIERQTGLYGPDARTVSALPPGLIIDVYA